MKTQIKLYGAFMLLFMFSISLFAENIQSVKDGVWRDKDVWSNGQLPTSTDNVTISHAISLNGDWEIKAGGSLIVDGSGSFSMTGKMHNNYGTLQLSGNMNLSGELLNMGSFSNTGTLNHTGYFKNTPNGMYTLIGNHSSSSGDFRTEGYWSFSGLMRLHGGELDNSGYLDGQQGQAYVCGDAVNGTAGFVQGTAYLCMECNGVYRNEGSGSFTLHCPFPVKLSSFDAASNEAGEVRLSWATASESNSDYFAVERAVIPTGGTCRIASGNPCGVFTEIGQVKASGNTSTEQKYSFLDSRPSGGVNFYRLRMVDTDGSFEYSPIIEMVFGDLATSLKVYPNPTNQILNVKVTGSMRESSELKIYDIAGRLVWKHKVGLEASTARLEIPVSMFSSGTYIVEFLNGKKQETKK